MKRIKCYVSMVNRENPSTTKGVVVYAFTVRDAMNACNDRFPDWCSQTGLVLSPDGPYHVSNVDRLETITV